MKLYYQKLLLGCFFLTGLFKITGAQESSDSIIAINNESAVLNIGFANQPKRITTSAISTVKGSDLLKTFNTNVANTLYGRLPGLTINQGSSEPGDNSPSLFARGINTFGRGSNLLVIVDGFLGEFTKLVPEEIEEISLLKDASAIAIYGNRGANGVLLITTKRGRQAPLSISFSTQQGFSQPTNLPKFLDAYNYASLYNEALANDGLSPLYSPADLASYQEGTDPYFRPDVNWYDEVLRKRAYAANYNLSFRGGNENVKYFVLLSAITSQGLFKNFGDMDDESRNSKYSRYNFRSNVDVNLTDRLSATLLLGGTVEDRSNPASISSAGTFNTLSLLPPNAFPVRNPDGSFGGNSTYTNPLANLLKTGYAESNGRTIQSSFRLTYDLSMITEGLSASGVVSFNNYFISGSNKTKSIERYSIVKGANGDTTYSKFGQTTSLSGSEPNLGQYRNYAIQAFLNYHRTFGKHNITAMGMFNSDNSTIDKGNIYVGTDNANLSLPYKNNGGAARLTYVNNEKYIAEFSTAYMGSENYAKGNRYGFFPAISAGWVVSQESFMEKSKALSFLKIRASYGLVGNDEIGGQRFMFDQRYPNVASYFLGTNNANAFAVAEGRLANPNVTWEKEKKINIGFDVTFFKQFDFSVDLFQHERYDILTEANREIPLYLGYTDLPFINSGKVNNKGFEADLKYRNKEKNEFQFFTELNVFYARNKIGYNAQTIQLNRGLITEGLRIGQFYGLRAVGLFQTDAEVFSSSKPAGIIVRPGDIKYEDIGGPLGIPDGIIDDNDRQPIGNTGIPEFTAGLHSGFQYKGFDLDFVLQAIKGRSIYLGANQFRPFQNDGQAGSIALERWTPQTAATATFPRLTADDNQNNYEFSSFYLRDGNFIKLRSAELGYSLPGKLINKYKLQQVRVYLTGTNIFSIDALEFGDPESLSGYPSLRTLTLGTRIQF